MRPQPPTIYNSPNHGGKRPTTLGVVLHSTRSGVPGRFAEYGRTVNYFMKPGTPASSHRVIGINEGQHGLLVADDLIAWHAQEDNEAWLSIEFAQPLIDDPYSAWQIETGIAVVTEWFRKYGLIPSKETIRRHQDTEQGKRNGKSDPGIPFPYEAFIGQVQEVL